MTSRIQVSGVRFQQPTLIRWAEAARNTDYLSLVLAFNCILISVSGLGIY
jgi:hypothetical protein